MGYYTKHSLEHNDTSDTDHDEGITALSGYSYSAFDDEIKWYDHKSDMRMYSKQYPEITFIISGVGEEEGDYWKEYYLSGKLNIPVPKERSKGNGKKLVLKGKAKHRLTMSD